MSRSRLAGLLSGKRLLIFDLDGTLVDSNPLHARAFQEVFAPEGISVDYRSIAGMTTESAVDKLMEAAGRTLDADARARLVGAKRERALQLLEADLEAIDGAVEFVRAARPRFLTALCTSASRRSAQAAIERIGLAGCFDPVITGEDIGRGKPDPQAFLMALEAHNVAAEEALVFEDSESGVQAAERAGIDVIQIAAVNQEPSVSWRALGAALLELQ